MEVFISWTSEDRDVKNAIVQRLQAEGIECWDSDESCVSDFSDECISAIKNCEVFIVLISNSSMSKGYVKNEVITARKLEDEGKLNILVYKITDEPYTNGFEFRLNHISFTNGNLIQRKETIGGESGIDNIVKRTKTLLKKRRDGEPEKPFDVKIPQISGLIINKTGYFVENSRNDTLSLFDNYFEESNVIVLKELFGFGKKSTIRKFAELNKDKYNNVIMVNNQAGSLREFFLLELGFDNINQKVFENLDGNDLIKEKFRLLEKLDEKTIIVIPDVKFESTPDEFICQKLTSLKCRIMLITQESPDRYTEWFPVINLGKMSDEHLAELFFHHYPHAYDDEKEALIPVLENFFAGIGGHTKTVELTASVLARDLGVHPEELPQYLSLQGSDGMKLKERIMNQISYLFTMGNLSEDEITILLVASYISVPRISEIKFRKVLSECGIDDWQLVMELDKHRWLDVDMRNRCVSIEPIIAKIIISKYPENYFVIVKCIESIMDQYSTLYQVLDDSSYSKTINKLSYILSAMNLDEMVQLLSAFNQYACDKENFDPESMKRAVAAYEEKYNPIKEACNNDCIYDEEPYDDDNSKKIYTFDDFLECLQPFFSSMLFTAKLISNGIILSSFYTFSQQSKNILSEKLGKQLPVFDTEEMFGISREELYDALDEMRKSYEENDDYDEDDIEYALILETIAATEAFFSMDNSAMALSINTITNAIENIPGILDGEIAEYLLPVVEMVVSSYINTKSYHSAISLCEKVLNKKNNPVSLLAFRIQYINALRSAGELGAKLFTAYEEALDGFEKKAAEALDSREDVFSKKKKLLLLYADDLASAENPEDAIKQFELAQKTGRNLHPDVTVTVAKNIAETLVNSGEFELASDFISKNFHEEYIAILNTYIDEEAKVVLEDLDVFKNLSSDEVNDFAVGEQDVYIDYYHNYSRKNNSLLEQKYCTVADMALKYDFTHLSDDEIREHAQTLKTKSKKVKPLSLAPEAFALAAEAGMRVLGYRHHYVQFMGAAAMADGKIAEILNGEGKTYTIVLIAFLNYLYEKKSFVIDSSSYLTKRNCEWMNGVYNFLGMNCKHIENQKQLYSTCSQIQPDVMYISTYDLIFAFLHNEIDLYGGTDSVKYDCAIIDEIDSVLVDSAQQPYSLVFSNRNQELSSFCDTAYKIARNVAFDESCYSFKRNQVTLKEGIYPFIEEYYNLSYDNINDLEKLKEIETIVKMAIHACNHYVINENYYLVNGVPMNENKALGILEHFSPMVEFFIAKSNSLDTAAAARKISNNNTSQNTICVRDMFKKFNCVCGTTATAVSFKEEFKEIYGLDYVSVPPFAPCIRKDYVSPVFLSENEKDNAIISFIMEKYEKRQPVLVIAQSIKESEKYSRLLEEADIPHKLLNARNKNDSSDMIALAGEPGSVLVTTYLVNRGADIKLGGNPELKTRLELVNLGVDTTELDFFIYSIATKEQQESSLYKKYYSILEKNKRLMLNAKQEVIKSGGLCVVGTSFFAEPRTEQQTRGRSGRQGEVGESIVFRSIDDDVIKSLFANSILQKILDNCADLDYVESSLINKSMLRFQKNLHSSKFAHIRHYNNSSWYTDKGRELFINKQFALKSGTVNVDDVIREWARDESVHSRIKNIPHELPDSSAHSLKKLARRNPNLLSASGRKLENLLSETFKAEIHEIFSTVNDDTVTLVLRQQLINGWEKYVNIVEQTLKNEQISKRALDKHFEKERRRLFSWAVESLVHMSVKNRKDDENPAR